MIQKLLSLMRRAINDFDMIHSGDKIAVGVSGGKDSLALLQLLCAYQKFSEHAFELCAVTVDMGFADSDFSPVERFCEELGVNYRREKTDIAEIIFDVRREKNPCSLCAKMRRGALNSVINEMGYNKLALGHHKNDVVDTFMLSLMFEGRLSTFQPVSYMSRSDVTLIRPLVYVSEREIAGLAKTLPVCKNPCPADKRSQREEMKKLLKDVAVKYPDVSDRIANAVMHPDRYNLWGMNKKQ